MRAVQQPDERAIGDRAGHVAQLRQPVQPQLAHAREVVLSQRRPRDDVGEQRERRAAANRLRTVTLATRRVGADVGVELRAEARERLVHLDRGAVAAALVEHVGGHRGQAVLARRIGRPRRAARAA